MGFTAVKFVLMVLFLAALVAAGVGMAELHVHATVAALIVASVSGLLLLRIRAESHQRVEAGHRVVG